MSTHSVSSCILGIVFPEAFTESPMNEPHWISHGMGRQRVWLAWIFGNHLRHNHRTKTNRICIGIYGPRAINQWWVLCVILMCFGYSDRWQASMLFHLTGAHFVCLCWVVRKRINADVQRLLGRQGWETKALTTTSREVPMKGRVKDKLLKLKCTSWAQSADFQVLWWGVSDADTICRRKRLRWKANWNCWARQPEDV